MSDQTVLRTRDETRMKIAQTLRGEIVRQGGVAGRYLKCGYGDRNTRSSTSDVRMSWPACPDWEASDD